MLEDVGIQKQFWARACNTAVYLLNRSPYSNVLNVTREETWSKIKPDLSNPKMFCCGAFVHKPDELRQKWNHKSNEYFF